MKRYNPKDIEPKWQKYWDEQQTYRADLSSAKPKFYGMSMFNYPSGAGIHIGHAMNYTISDVLARFKRQQGYESYHPVGWDAFGLPAENYAIKSGVSPQKSMETIIPMYHKQYRAMGWSNDWSKEVATHEPEYYKWTQWIFTQMFNHGLAYQDSRMQWWCSIDKTVLANEQVIDGKCWRHDGPNDPPAEKKEIKQWFFKITDYADELLEATDDLDWTESVKLAQKNWIGKSQGAEIKFAIDGSGEAITVFTTRPDTIYGATFLVIAPEHDQLMDIVSAEQKSAVEAYKAEVTKKTDVERQASKDKTGVFTGAYAVNPASGEKIPVWVADYVLVGYGTGAIMAVPAHDERDNEFAEKFSIPITEVIAPSLMGTGKNASREDVDTLDRKVVDVIIRNLAGQYLLLIEPDNVHFVGGGIESEDVDAIAAVKRETIEETGFTDFASVKEVSSTLIMEGYRIPKKLNQRTEGKFYEVVLSSDKRVRSEVDEGVHAIKWVSKDKVASLLTWEHHAMAWQQYLAGNPCYTGEGVIINSGKYDGMPSSEAREKIVADLGKRGLATPKTTYKIRDWSVSRQRYWGAPIPMVHCAKDGAVPVPDDQLPVVLPEISDYEPTGDGRSALARATEWLTTSCPKCGGPAERETDTLDTYICSSWYMLRYLDPHNDKQAFSSEVVNKWMPVDFYNGADHATAHMIYARFVTRFFHKLGLIDEPEPFKRFLFNGKVTAANGEMFSKSKGNGVDPLEIIGQGYGADALRTYLMFAAPLELWIRWDPQGVPGAYRFLNRVWNITQEFLAATSTDATHEEVLKIIHPAIKKVTADLEDLKYNTAIATLMKCTNELYELKAKKGFASGEDWRFALSSLVQLIAPFAPHTAEELWHDLGKDDSVHRGHWPAWEDKYLVQDTITVAVQVNGKVRGEIELAPNASEDEAIKAAEVNEKVQAHLEGKQIVKTIYVPGKIVNIVVK